MPLHGFPLASVAPSALENDDDDDAEGGLFLRRLGENVALCSEHAFYETATLQCPSSRETPSSRTEAAHRHLRNLSKSGPPRLVAELRQSKRCWADLNKRDRKALTDSVLFRALPPSQARLGSKLFALQSLHKGGVREDGSDAALGLAEACSLASPPLDERDRREIFRLLESCRSLGLDALLLDKEAGSAAAAAATRTERRDVGEGGS